MRIEIYNKSLLFKTMLVWACALAFQPVSVFSQANVSVTIDSGNSTTSCIDFLNPPEPRWRVNVNNNGWVVYPMDGSCFNNPPNIQFDEVYDCPNDAPNQITVCFEAFEDDGSNCNLDEECLQNICNNYTIPLPGVADSHTLALPAGLSSGGEVNFTIETIGDYRGGLNDKMCGAFDLGVLSPGGVLGDASLSNLNNYCSNGAGEPNPANSGAGWSNNLSVWFSFTTSNDPSSIIRSISRSDPQNLGEPMNIQLALYQSDDGTCTGNFTMVTSRWASQSLDERLLANCLEPNTTYYLLVDGFFPPGSGISEGLFGLEIRDESIEYSADLICDASDLGIVPDGGQVSSGPNQSNVCATNINDPSIQNFSTEQSVWFTFTAPASRHVLIEGISDTNWPTGIDALDIQIAAFESSNGACDGTLTELGSNYDNGSFDESLELGCLEPGNTYFLLLDGGPNDLSGVFEVSVSDAGYDPIMTTLDTIICFGTSLMVGNTMYNTAGNINENIVTADGCDSLVTGTLMILPEVTYSLDTAVCFGNTIMVGISNYVSTGNYIDVLTDINGCDSTVFTNFTVADELTADATQTIEATAYQAADGEATVNVNGGISGFTYVWSDGQTTQTAINLNGGETYCVTVTDNIGCTIEDCVLVLFPSNILTTLESYFLTCPGDSDGELSLSISNGVIPYNYDWANGDNSLNGTGTIATEGGTAVLNGLPSGNYSFTISDAFGIKVVDGEIIDPPAIVTTIDTTLCFGESLLVGMVNYSTSGLISEVLNSSLGCDSTVNGVVNILPLNETILDQTLCFGESLMVGTASYNTTGAIAETLTGINGCDSLVNGSLTILPEIISNLDTTLCFGESLMVGTQVFNATTSFNEVVSAFNGCDSTIQGTVVFLPENTLDLDATLCFGASIEVGTSTYSSTGNYVDVLTSNAGCDSTVYTNLVILTEMNLTVDIVSEATAYLDPSGVANATPMGSSGNYTYLWSNGATTPIVNNLEGGMNYCVTVTDDFGCSVEDCVLMLFPSNIQTTLPSVVLNCPGDVNGVLSLSVFNGVIPYAYQWQNTSNTLNGSGSIATEGGLATVNSLPEGDYSFTITDAFGETTATAQVIDPQQLITPINETLCFGESLTVGTTVYTTSSLVNETLTSYFGCDSTVVGVINVLPLNETILNETLCFGESLPVGTATYTTSGMINETIPAFNGCDSVVSGMLTILPEISTLLDPVVCFGSSYEVGTSSYTTSGNFVDVLTAFNGCDSTVFTNLTVLQDLGAVATQDTDASGLGVSDGTASVTINGGSGNVNYEWSNGQSTAQATGLTGGENYCVTVTDNVGCSTETCVLILFPVNIITTIENDTLDCLGTSDGSLNFTISNGQAPYQYTWQNTITNQNGTGTLALEGGMANVGNLPSGNYEITITDPWGQTIINADVVEPDPIVIDFVDEKNASCFGNCDAGVTVTVSGGRSPYQYAWPAGQNTATVADLCAGNHQVTITDALNCTAFRMVTLGEPAEFIATALEMEPVNCFGGNDGQASVSTNGTPIAYLWDNGETTEMAIQLNAGAHNVTVTNLDNCTDITNVIINEPLASLSVGISIETPISCFDAADGILMANVTGGSNNPLIEWSNGDTDMQAEGLSGGNYSLTVTDDMGCTFTTALDFSAPDPIDLSFAAFDVTCLDGPTSGALMIENVVGGVGPYLFSMDGNFYTADSAFVRLTSGNYELFVEDASGCVATFPALINDPPVLVVDLGADDEVDLGEAFDLEALSNSNDLTYLWSAVEELECDTCAEMTIFPKESSVYSVVITDTLTHCTASDDIRINVKKDRNVFIPNVFSPNGDGANDRLVIHGGIDVTMVRSFRVYNRWGALVYERSNFPANDNSGEVWDGMWDGKRVENGVYVYAAEIEFFDGKQIMYSGDITVLK